MPKRNRKKAPEIPRELDRAGALCLAFSNSGTPRRDGRRQAAQAPARVELATFADLVAWGRRMKVLDATDSKRLLRIAAEQPGEAVTLVVQAISLRTALQRIFAAHVRRAKPKPEDLERLNASITKRRVVLATDGYRADWGEGPDALDRTVAPIAESALDLLVSDQLAKVQRCPGKGCQQLFLSHDPRRVWCDANTCGSRAKGKRYQQFLKNIAAQDRQRRQDERQEWMAQRAKDAKSATS